MKTETLRVAFTVTVDIMDDLKSRARARGETVATYCRNVVKDHLRLDDYVVVSTAPAHEKNQPKIYVHKDTNLTSAAKLLGAYAELTND